MNKPDSHIHKLIDSMTCSNTSFAIYRLPWTDIPLMVMQDGGEPQTFSSLKELNGQKGFVISPFSFTSNHPGVIIRPDITATGWEEISEKISSITISDTEQECTSTAIDIKPETELKERYMEVFANFISPLKSKKIGKLVLSRNASYKLDENFSPLEAFVTACNSYPRMMISLSHTPVSGTWIGSSKVIKKFSSKIAVKGPYTARAGQLVHLRTDFQFGLKKTSELGNLLDALHPTPAVCGMPKDKAYDFIIENEGYDRKYYSGIIGWLNPEGHTTLYVNLRCLNIDGNYATLYAGGGILPSSDANSEWEETQHKMKTIKLVISC